MTPCTYCGEPATGGSWVGEQRVDTCLEHEDRRLESTARLHDEQCGSAHARTFEALTNLAVERNRLADENEQLRRVAEAAKELAEHQISRWGDGTHCRACGSLNGGHTPTCAVKETLAALHDAGMLDTVAEESKGD